MASVTRRTGERGNDRREVMEDRLQQAMERLLEKGSSFTQVSVEQLAVEAGIARATFYLHFRDKGELVSKLMAGVTQDVVAAAQLPSEDVTREQLRAVIKKVVKLYLRHYAVMSAIVETAAYDAQVEQLFQKMMDRLCDVNRQMLQRRKQAGRIPADTPNQLADVLTWAFERSCHQLIHGRSAAQVNGVIDSLTLLLWTSLHAPKREDEPGERKRRR
ncbi:MAG: TetR/AcrR family transcriptional regulator [Lysobacter sp.]